MISCYFFLILSLSSNFFFFFFNDTATTEIYTLSLHDALPIFNIVSIPGEASVGFSTSKVSSPAIANGSVSSDRKSTRLNSSHTVISYAVFCLKKKKKYRLLLLFWQFFLL